MPRLRATIPHPDAHRLVHLPHGSVVVEHNEVITDDADVIHFLLRNDFVMADDAAQPASTNPSASAMKDAVADGAAERQPKAPNKRSKKDE